MSYIAVDLKVIEGLAGQVARSAGTSEDRILAGLVRLWHRCWATTTDVVSRAQLAGVMGGEALEVVADALVQLDFLEAVDGGWRVRGARRYLRLKAARKAGAEKTNAARSRATPKRRSRAQTSDAQATLPDALTPSTEHRAPKEEKSIAPAPRTPRESDRLLADFQEIIGSRYVYGGDKDAVAFAALRKTETLDEISKRWRRGLSASGFLGVRTLAELRSKWNHLAQEPTGPPSNRSPAPVADWSNAVAGEIPA